MRNFGIQSRRATSGAVDNRPPAYGARNTGAGSNSYPLPAESIFHLENVPHPRFEIPVRVCVAIFIAGLICLFTALYYGAWWLFGV